MAVRGWFTELQRGAGRALVALVRAGFRLSYFRDPDSLGTRRGRRLLPLAAGAAALLTRAVALSGRFMAPSLSARSFFRPRPGSKALLDIAPRYRRQDVRGRMGFVYDQGVGS